MRRAPAADAAPAAALAADGRADSGDHARASHAYRSGGGARQAAAREYETSAGTPRDRQRNALIVSMLAYAGLRPIEDRGCVWGDVQDRTLHVFATKTGRPRDVDLLGPLAQEPR